MPEVADAFRRFGSSYQEAHGAAMLPSHHRAIADIIACRTEALGGQQWCCNHCGTLLHVFHSCAGFRTPAMTRLATRSETGVGKAPRHEIAGKWAPSAPWALWGFSRGVRLGKVGSNCPWPSHCFAGWVWTTGGAGVAEADWQCHCGPI